MHGFTLRINPPLSQYENHCLTASPPPQSITNTLRLPYHSHRPVVTWSTKSRLTSRWLEPLNMNVIAVEAMRDTPAAKVQWGSSSISSFTGKEGRLRVTTHPFHEFLWGQFQLGYTFSSKSIIATERKEGKGRGGLRWAALSRWAWIGRWQLRVGWFVYFGEANQDRSLGGASDGSATRGREQRLERLSSNHQLCADYLKMLWSTEVKGESYINKLTQQKIVASYLKLHKT